MEQGKITVFTGSGHGKTSAALGNALQRAALGKNVVVIQFLKGKGLQATQYLQRLEPEIKLFRFEKSIENFTERTEEEKKEEIANIRNGLGYARKVLSTGECSLLVLDEVLGLVNNDILSNEELRAILDSRGETDIILTGLAINEEVCRMADEINEIEMVKSCSLCS
ncbi:MAG: cob(I)yrinic acid a,c-diamide adenosyltransferase [Eubacteriales bacterium]|nr:cob(I)yrinic acid a,c-diamide adenosyltransferase [Eubacteriales bacterium]